MLSQTTIRRHFSARRFGQLVQAVADNGFPVPDAVKASIASSPAAAVALGLWRLAGLTWSPTPVSQDMAAFLLDSQLDDGSWDHDPLATAIAVAAIGQLIHDFPSQRPDMAFESAYQRGLAALAGMQREHGLFMKDAETPIEQAILVSAMVLLVLGSDPQFQQTVHLATLTHWVQGQRDRLTPDARRLWRIARVDTEPTAPRSPYRPARFRRPRRA